MKNNGIISNIIYAVFFAIGIGLLIGSIAMFKNAADFKETADKVSARIIRIEKDYDSDDEVHYSVYVTYSYNGVVYDDIYINFYNSNMAVGKEISLLCDPEYPTYVREDSVLDAGGMILLFMGIIFGAVGGIPLLLGLRKSMQAKRLMQEGQVLHATVEMVDFNTSYSVNGVHPFVIYCTYKDVYKDIIYRFKSNNLWTDPSPIFPPGSYIDVMVDPNDYSKYHVKAEQMIEQKIVDFT